MPYHRVYPRPIHKSVRGTILAFHGGCFTGGSVEYDQDQNRALQEAGFQVIQLHFPKTVQEFRTWFQELNFMLPKPICVLGRSSGGYLAKEAYEMSKQGISKLKIEAAIYLAPVFSPFVRSELVPKMSAKTESFFSNDAPIDTTGPLDPQELLVLARRDENVPVQCFTKEQLEQAHDLGIQTHSGMCTTSSKKFIELITAHLEERANAVPKTQIPASVMSKLK